MTYAYWLLAISAVFAVLEAVVPWRRDQVQLRRGLIRDLAFNALNGHFFSVWTAAWAAWLATQANGALATLGIGFDAPLLANQHVALQFLVYFVVTDFLQWCIHNLLHRVPILWRFHKVHHSIPRLDWLANMHFHWFELVVYKSLQYLPIALMGASGDAIMAVAVFGTVWGHLNHSNLRIELGPLRYVFNSPSMHLWHHDASDEGGVAKNFGIVLSCWDFLFRTAFWPQGRHPERLGYPGDETMPESLPGQLLWGLLPEGLFRWIQERSASTRSA